MISATVGFTARIFCVVRGELLAGRGGEDVGRRLVVCTRNRRRGSAVEPARLMKDYLRIPRPMAENVMRIVREQEQVA
jgi:hypothetical protein